MNQISLSSRRLRYRTKLLKKIILLIVVLGMAAWVVLKDLPASPKSSAQSKSAGPPLVRGYIATTVSTGKKPNAEGINKDIYLPGVNVFLRDTNDKNNVAGPVKTDLSGRFSITASKPGNYRVCWRMDGYLDGCAKDVLNVADPIFVNIVRIQPERRKDPKASGVVFGTVKMADGSRPRKLNPMMSINAFAKVALFDARKKKRREVFVNNLGEYVITQVPVSQNIALRATIEGATRNKPISLRANIGKAPFDPVNIVIGNTPPRIDAMIGNDDGGVRVKAARPGEKIVLKSRTSDKDGDALILKWQADAGSGTLMTPDSADTVWQLPGRPGRYSVKLLAWDKKGGYDESDISFETGDGSIRFSGKVDGTDAQALEDAEVEVNGRTVRTDKQGLFSTTVPDDKRFVLNIRKPGYGLVSNIYDRSVTGGRWTMTKASTTRTDAGATIRVTDDRDKRNCPGPDMNKLGGRLFSLDGGGENISVEWQDGKGNAILPPKKGREVEKLLPITTKTNSLLYEDDQSVPCSPGAQVEIAPNTLQDATGKLATGPVDVSLTTIDLRSPKQMPGDFSVQGIGGGNGMMESYGAVSIDITSGGTRLNLVPGNTARVTIPIDPSLLAPGAFRPATIPLLFYDERKGIWVEEGTATLSGNAYVADVKHFSSINMDLIKTNQSCVRVLSSAISGNFDLEVTVPNPAGGGAAPIVRRTSIINDTDQHVIYNLPSNTNIILVPIRQDNSLPMGTFIVNTGGAQAPTFPNLPVGPPYDACSTEVTLADRGVPLADGIYLEGLGTFQASNLDDLDTSSTPGDNQLADDLRAATQRYYDQIDPHNKRDNFEKFKTVNGFAASPTTPVADEIRASFTNGGDLGFGRDMHCKEQPSQSTTDSLSDYACYVTNYGNSTTDNQQDADRAFEASPANVVATVAMEFSAIEGPGGPEDFDDPERVVKFYVYNADGSLRLSANLDERGERPVPQLCMVCHNGVYPGGDEAGVPTFTNRNDTKLSSRFLPFDLHYYVFPTAHDKAAQQGAIKGLNDLVKETHTQELGSRSASPAIADLIDKLYIPASTPPVQNEDPVVDGWNGAPIDREMYKNVVARTCRTCHVASVFDQPFDPADPNPRFPLVFAESGRFKDLLGTAENLVCGSHIMPHAVVPHNLFWKSVASLGPGGTELPSSGQSIPALFQAFGDEYKTADNGWQGTRCGEFTGGGTTPVSYYASTIQPIWDGDSTSALQSCTSCHTGASGDAGLNLDPGVSYGNLVDIFSGQATSLQLVRRNSAANSYVVHKLANTQSTVGGSGVRMPRNRPALNANTQTTIRDWIDSGAPGP